MVGIVDEVAYADLKKLTTISAGCSALGKTLNDTAGKGTGEFYIGHLQSDCKFARIGN